MLRISHVGGQRGFASRPPEIKSSIISLECKHSIRDFDGFYLGAEQLPIFDILSQFPRNVNEYENDFHFTQMLSLIALRSLFVV